MSDASHVNISYDASNQMTYTDPDTGDVFVYNGGDIAWTLASTALVWIMIPGLGYFYAGLLRRKNALSMMFLSMATVAVVSFQWFFWGFSLAFSEGANRFIGDLKYFGMQGVFEKPAIGSARIPAVVFAIYQLMFAAITPMLALGATADRGRLGPSMLFVFIWSTLVYDPMACWTWNINGWSAVLGGLDFAGGTPVHISSGAGSLAITLFLGKRRGFGTRQLAYQPHNTSYVILGTALLWFGWFGFNGGSALSANLRAAEACLVTNLAASVGGITWMLWDYRLEKKWSAVGFCSGAVSGLVAITPASGFVGMPAAVAFGIIGGTACNFATKIKRIFNFDDALDILASHGVGGIVGNLLTGIFADSAIAALDGVTAIPGGWINQHWVQLGIQLADSTAGFSYSFVMTTIILWVMHFIPGCSMRCSEETEILGIDDAEMGEFAYDYVSMLVELSHRSEYESQSKQGSSADVTEVKNEV